MPGVNLEPGDVLLVRGTSLISRLIRVFDGSDVSHAAIYTGGETEDVAEVTGIGVHTSSLSKMLSDPHTEYVVVSRLAEPRPAGFVGSVLDRARHYLGRQERYAYEQIVLLALLGLSRMIPASPRFRMLMRHVCDHAAARLLDIVRCRGKEPLICSEFVFRCYDEADGPSKPVPRPILLSAEYPGASRRPRAATESLGSGEPGEGENLLEWALAGGGASEDIFESTQVPADDAAFAPAIPFEDLERLASAYLEEGSAEAESVQEAIPANDDELLRSIERFARAWSESSQPGDGAESLREDSGRDGSSARDSYLRALAYAAADFVTPGDLLRSHSLAQVTRDFGGARRG